MNGPDIDTDEVSMLLPWYVNGTLGEEERSQVSEHLESCASCRASVVELQRMASVLGRETATPLISEPPVDKFLELTSIGKRKRTKQRRAPLYAVAASILGLAVTAWLFMNIPEENNVFRTVTDPSKGDTVSYVFSIEIALGAQRSVRESLEKAINGGSIMEIENGYRVVVARPSATMSELDRFADSLRNIDGVSRVDVVGVQLPVE